MRIESEKRCKNGGWLHRLANATQGRAYTPQAERPAVTVRWDLLLKQFAPKDGVLAPHAIQLGLSEASLLRLGCGWDGEALTFPMVSDAGVIQGIRRRFPDGRKKAVTGGREGLFIPTGQESHAGPVFVCEGPTDCCALLDLGFCAIGRPSCLGAEDFTMRYVGKRKCVIIADNDGPGRGGALSLVRKIPHALIIVPPANIKDARAWLIAGATMGDVLSRCKQGFPSPGRV